MAPSALAIAASTWGVLMGVSPVLQIRRMLRERSSRDVSLGYFTVLLIGFILWIAYGTAAGDLALVIPNSVALFVGVVLVIIALRLRPRPEPRPDMRGPGPGSDDPGPGRCSPAGQSDMLANMPGS